MTVFYPDVSDFEAGISLKGALIAGCKVTESTNYINPDYLRAKNDAAVNGTMFFAYHFLHAGNAGAQAAWAFQHAGTVPLMLDIEPTTGSNPTIADVITFLVEYRQLGGICHLGYLPKWYWEDLGSPSLTAVAAAGMCLVSSDYMAYSDSSAAGGWQPYGGVTPTVWQYTDDLSFNDFSCDFNAFRGTHAGDQSAAGVAATLVEFSNILHYGTLTPPPVMVTIPVTYGEAASVAIANIEAHGLHVVCNPERNPANTYQSIGSSPIGGTKVKRGSTITLNVKIVKKG